MNKNLKAYLDSLPAGVRSIIVEKLGDLAVETPEEKLTNLIRKAAGLPDVDTNEGSDPIVAAARKAAGLS